MSDRAAEHFNGQELPNPEAPVAAQTITLSVSLHPDGKIDFKLPAGNKILAYGLLEVARAQLDKVYLLDEAKQQAASRGGMHGLLRRMNGG